MLESGIVTGDQTGQTGVRGVRPCIPFLILLPSPDLKANLQIKFYEPLPCMCAPLSICCSFYVALLTCINLKENLLQDHTKVLQDLAKVMQDLAKPIPPPLPYPFRGSVAVDKPCLKYKALISKNMKSERLFLFPLI